MLLRVLITVGFLSDIVKAMASLVLADAALAQLALESADNQRPKDEAGVRQGTREQQRRRDTE